MVWIIVLLVITKLIVFLAYCFRKNSRHKKVAQINSKVQKESDKFVKLMTKIIHDPSFAILDEPDEFQIITFDHSLFGFGEVNWLKLPKAKFEWLLQFFVFLVGENNQYPVIFIKGKYLVVTFKPKGQPKSLLLNKSELQKHLRGVKKMLGSNAIFFDLVNSL